MQKYTRVRAAALRNSTYTPGFAGGRNGCCDKLFEPNLNQAEKVGRMWRFVLRENIRRFEALMALAKSEEQRATLRQLLREAQSELEELESASTPDIAKGDEWLNVVVNRAVDQAMALQQAQFASLQIYDETREHLIILAQRNLRAAFLHHLSQVKTGDGSACGRCLAEKAPVIVHDVSSDTGFHGHRQAAHEAGFQAVHAFPVLDGSDNLIAVLSTYFESSRVLSTDETDRMIDFANSLGRNIASHIGPNRGGGG